MTNIYLRWRPQMSKMESFATTVNPLMPGGNKKVTHTSTNLQLNAQRSAAGLFKYV